MWNLLAPHRGERRATQLPVRSRRRLAVRAARVSENRRKVLVSLDPTGHLGQTAGLQPGFRAADALGSFDRPGGYYRRLPRSAFRRWLRPRPRRVTSSANRSAAASRSAADVRAVPQHVAADARQHVAAPRRRRPPGRSAGRRALGADAGGQQRAVDRQVDARPRRGWRRRPRRPSRAGRRRRSPRRCGRASAARRDRPSAARGALHLGALRVGGQRQHEDARRRRSAAASSAGRSEPKPRYGADGHRVARTAASPCRGRWRRRRPSWSRCRRAWRPSAPARRPRGPRSTARSSTAMPREPKRSKNADCGLRTATRSASASTTVRVKRSRPATSSSRPQAAEQRGVRVDADAQRAAGVHGAAQPRAEGFRAGPVRHAVTFLVSAPTASARVAYGLAASRAARPLWIARHPERALVDEGAVALDQGGAGQDALPGVLGVLDAADADQGDPVADPGVQPAQHLQRARP